MNLSMWCFYSIRATHGTVDSQFHPLRKWGLSGYHLQKDYSNSKSEIHTKKQKETI